MPQELNVQYINSEKSYTYSGQALNLKSAEVPIGWLLELAELCSNKTEADRDAFIKNLNVHIGEKATYAAKQNLIEGLQFIYGVLSGKIILDEKKAISANLRDAIVAKLHEEIKACTPGYHDRVNEVLAWFNLPQSIDDYLTAIRTEIVREIASGVSPDVHVSNRFLNVASIRGFGVKPINTEDAFTGHIQDSSITDALNDKFPKKYTPFLILEDIINRIKTVFNTLNYKGVEPKGYSKGEYDAFRDAFIKLGLIDPNTTAFSIMQMDGDPNEDLDVKCTDINWDKIKLALWQYLCENQYFSYTEQQLNCINTMITRHQILDQEQFLELFAENGKELVRFIHYFNLTDIDFSGCYQEFSKDSTALTSAEKLKFLFELLPLAHNKQAYVTHILHYALTTSIFETTLPEILLLAIENQSEYLVDIFNAADALHHNHNNGKSILTSLNEENWENLTSLIYKKPNVILLLADYIAKLDPLEQKYILTRKGKNVYDSNLLEIASMRQATAVRVLLELIEKYNGPYCQDSNSSKVRWFSI